MTDVWLDKFRSERYEAIPEDATLLAKVAKGDDSRVHNWLNYLDGDMEDHWTQFTPRERAIIYSFCSSQANAEEWD